MSRLDPATVDRLHQVRALGAGPRWGRRPVRRAGRRRRPVLYAVPLVAAGWLGLVVGGLRPW